MTCGGEIAFSAENLIRGLGATEALGLDKGVDVVGIEGMFNIRQTERDNLRRKHGFK